MNKDLWGKLKITLLLGFFGFILIYYLYNTRYPIIVVLDEIKIRSKAKPFLKINEFVDSYNYNAQKELHEQESLFRKEYEEIQNSLEPRSVIELKKQKFKEKIDNLHKKIEEKQEFLNKKLSRISDHILKTMQEIIKEIAISKDIKLVLNISDKLSYIDNSVDITDEIIRKLEQKIDISKDFE